MNKALFKINTILDNRVVLYIWQSFYPYILYFNTIDKKLDRITIEEEKCEKYKLYNYQGKE